MVGVTICFEISDYPIIKTSNYPNRSIPFVEKTNVLSFFSIQKPDSIVDACQALSKARELRAH